MAGNLGHGTGLTPTGHASVDEARILAHTLARTQAEPLHDAGAKSLDYSVNVGTHSEHHAGRLRILEIQRHRASASRRHVLPRLAIRRRFGAHPVDENDLRAHIVEQHRAKRTRADAREFDDLEPFQPPAFNANAAIRPAARTDAAPVSRLSLLVKTHTIRHHTESRAQSVGSHVRSHRSAAQARRYRPRSP